ncbi:MAG: hypothetical protein E6Q36_00160 [Chryseobacterium sp.]|nr:MAG: hypothetical protein E6Q36_00160 [Chryseobacterium sp.]
MIRLAVWQTLGLPVGVSQIIEARGQSGVPLGDPLSLSDGGFYSLVTRDGGLGGQPWRGHYEGHTIWLAVLPNRVVAIVVNLRDEVGV